MDMIRKRLRKLADQELRTISKAIDRELRHRQIQSGSEVENADREDRPMALPVRVTGHRSRKLRRAA